MLAAARLCGSSASSRCNQDGSSGSGNARNASTKRPHSCDARSWTESARPHADLGHHACVRIWDDVISPPTGTVLPVRILLYSMSSPPKKNFASAAAERHLELFLEAIEQFDCQGDEDRFDEVVRTLARGKPPAHVPVRCDECYLKAALFREGDREFEHWPTPPSSCRHLPIESCPSIKAAFARARGVTP